MQFSYFIVAVNNHWWSLMEKLIKLLKFFLNKIVLIKDEFIAQTDTFIMKIIFEANSQQS